MAKYIFKRILTAIPLIIVITILCFSLIHLAPYDNSKDVSGDGTDDP